MIPNKLKEGKYNGYGPSVGFDGIREAVAKKYSSKEAPLAKDDVVLSSGCSHALDMAIATLVEEGCNLLIPQPGFSLYQTLCEYHNIEYRHYSLDPSNNWEINLDHLENLIDSKTKAILINNPSNPCGSNFSKTHLTQILQVALKHKLPIISDEIYADMVFPSSNQTFHPIATLSQEVPILTCGGLAKKYMLPGWRLGWILIHDRKGRFEKVREGIRRVSTTILGASSLIQSAVPEILEKTEPAYFQNTLNFLSENAQLVQKKLKDVHCLTLVAPQAAMYMMIGIKIKAMKDIFDDVQFSQELLSEEVVSVLPGSCFHLKNFFRIVLCVERKDLEESLDRIIAFCLRHSK